MTDLPNLLYKVIKKLMKFYVLWAKDLVFNELFYRSTHKILISLD